MGHIENTAHLPSAFCHGECPMAPDKVMVDDNFHHQDSDARREHGSYETLEEALAACRDIVDRSLEARHNRRRSLRPLWRPRALG